MNAVWKSSWILLAALLGGCSFAPQAGEARLEALGGAPLVLAPEFRASAATQRDTEHSFWFSTVTLEQLAETGPNDTPPDAVFVHVQLVWLPKPGMTPLDATAVNAAVRVVVVSGGEIGIYAGGAFVRPEGLEEPDTETWNLEIEGGTVSLVEKTARFTDLLSPAEFRGSFSATRDAAATNAWRRAVSQLATNRFGRSMWVMAPDVREGMLAAR